MSSLDAACRVPEGSINQRSPDDEDLAMAARESEQHSASIQNEAYRQALSELAGELYVEAYKESMQTSLATYTSRWNLDSFMRPFEKENVRAAGAPKWGTCSFTGYSGCLGQGYSSEVRLIKLPTEAHVRTQSHVMQESIEWLLHARAILNPLGIVGHSVKVAEFYAFMQYSAPPPPPLQKEWDVQVWSLPGEPYAVYLLRCLAHQSGITLLSPHFAVGDWETDQENWRESTARGAVATDTPAACTDCPAYLFRECCVVVGVRKEPCTDSLLQTGWDTQPCPCCFHAEQPYLETSAGAALRGPPPQNFLPLLFGGSRCDTCARALPLKPTWTRVLYVVLQRSDRSRTAAVAYGEEVHAFLGLGMCVDAVLYESVTAQHEPHMVVHAASLVQDNSPDAPLRRMSPAAAVSPFRQFLHQEQTSRAAHRWSHRTAVEPGTDLYEVAARIAPQLQGLKKVKAALLLAMLSALYGVCYPSSAKLPTHAKHLLIVGAAKTGKSTLLYEVSRLMGTHAELLDPTVVRGAGGGGGDSRGAFLAALPTRRNAVLMAGACLTATTLVLDHLSTCSSGGAALMPLLEAIERGTCSTGSDNRNVGGSNLDVYRLTANIIAAAGDESAAAVQLAPYFSLVVSAVPTRSLDETAIISQDVVAASRARSSRSRADSRGSSLSTQSSTSSPHRSQRSSSNPNESPCRSETIALSSVLTHEDLMHFVRHTAAPALLRTVMSRTVCYERFLGRLLNCAGLLEDVQLPACSSIPSPAACRGQNFLNDPIATHRTLRATPLQLQEHLRSLCWLSRARLILEPEERVRQIGFTENMCDEVWSLYYFHLVTSADLLHHRDSTGGAPPVSMPCASSGSSAIEVDRLSLGTAFALQHQCNGAAALEWGRRMNSSGVGLNARIPQKKLSKKRCRLLLADELQRMQRCSGTPDSVISKVEVEQLFSLLGGGVAFGDPLDVVMGQLQEEGLALRRPGGWRVP